MEFNSDMKSLRVWRTIIKDKNKLLSVPVKGRPKKKKWMIYKEMGLFLQSEMVDIIYGFQELGFTISLGGEWVEVGRIFYFTAQIER